MLVADRENCHEPLHRLGHSDPAAGRASSAADAGQRPRVVRDYDGWTMPARSPAENYEWHHDLASGHLALDDHLDQMRTLGRDGSRQGARQLAGCRDALCRDPEPAGEIEEAKPRLPQIHVEVGAIGLGPEALPVNVHVVLEDAVLAVVEDDEHDGQIVVG